MVLPRSDRDRLAEAFINGYQAGAENPEASGDGNTMYQSFCNWFDRIEPLTPLEGET